MRPSVSVTVGSERDRDALGIGLLQHLAEEGGSIPVSGGGRGRPGVRTMLSSTSSADDAAHVLDQLAVRRVAGQHPAVERDLRRSTARR